MAAYASRGPTARALVVGDLLYTVSDDGVLATHLGSLTDAAWLPYR